VVHTTSVKLSFVPWLLMSDTRTRHLEDFKSEFAEILFWGAYESVLEEMPQLSRVLFELISSKKSPPCSAYHCCRFILEAKYPVLFACG
jgi:hypothetical protein